ncbi:TPA: H-NS family nucleoid-associated regulatory protein [Haemophilus influenzae]
MTTLESFNRLNNIRTLRVLLREEISTQDLEDFKDKILLVLEEKKEEEKMIAEKQKQQQEKLEEVKQILEQKGLTAEDLSAFLNITEVKEKKERKKAEPKYKFLDAQGNEKLWTGQGRTPKELVGKNLEDFLI